MFLFHFLILFEQRFVFLLNFFGEWLLFRHFRFFLRLCSRGCRRRLDRIGRKRFYSVGIIQFEIQTEMQRFIKCLAQIFGNTVNTTCMCIDDSRFPILVCTYFGIRAYHILRKSLKELVAGYLRTTVNYRLDEKFFVCR